MAWTLNFILSVTGTCWRDWSRELIEVCICSENTSDSSVRNRKWQNFAVRREKPAQLLHTGGSKHQQKEEPGGIKDQKQIERFQLHLITPGGRNTLISPSTTDMPACATLLNTKRNRNFDFPGDPSFR